MALIKAQVDDSLYERLRKEAYDSHRSMSQVIAAAVEQYLNAQDELR